MNFLKYLKDQKFLMFFYVVLMAFISAVIFLDGTSKVSLGNILYINLASIVFFIIYLLGKYLHFNNYYKALKDIIDTREYEIINRIPEPRSYSQKLYHNLLEKIYEEQSLKLQKLYDNKKENEEFITSWVHQIKTPITVSRLLIENNLGKANSDVLLSLEEELDKIDNYVEQALYNSKIDDFSKDYLISEVSVDRVVKDTVKKHAKNFINKKISVEIKDTELIVLTDKKWLSFILDQILSNSLKYTSNSGKISIYGIKQPKLQKLVIEDTGIGITSEDVNRVFDKGFTGYNGRQNYKSTGMGLYLSKKLALKLGHDIIIESEQGKYTRVTIAFPKLLDYLDVSRYSLKQNLKAD
ncbi:ATPase/histidine kinase/DNA gyrase B/HSP90 domain protein [Clostridiales bacterium oral taxon 876 str. F0540]|nr:ATPase/histidine kinase/DNA gyrase B/HSP90 domain protein [Clostridiales bacterium oral taxon 876 str. F0540]